MDIFIINIYIIYINNLNNCLRKEYSYVINNNNGGYYSKY